MPPKPNAACITPVIRKGISAFRRSFGLKRETLKKAEGLLLDQGLKVPIWSKMGDGMFESARQARVWRGEKSAALNAVGKTIKPGEAENVLMAIIDEEGARNFHKVTADQLAKAKKMEAVMVDTLMDGVGMSKAQATQFLKKDLVQLRKAQGDTSRMNPNNIYPESFQPILDELRKGSVSATTSNVGQLAWDLVNMGERVRFLTPSARTAEAEVASWAKMGMHKDDLLQATSIAQDFIKANYQQHEHTAGILASGISKVASGLSKAVGGKGIGIDDATINTWAMHMAGWYGGVAMSMRPALAMRNMTQVMLPATKVGFGHLGASLKEVYGKDRELIVNRALKQLGISQESVDTFLGESAAGRPLANRVFQGARDLQRKGLAPYRWADVKHNRVVTYRMGERAIEQEAPHLLKGNISWEQFMMRTGLAGSPKVDQIKIKSLLQGKEHANIAQASAEYGKILVEDTQFIYDSVNSPLAFQGTLGRLFGQFGIWPIAFTEFMASNLGTRNAAYTQKFLGNYAVQKAALMGVGAGVGVDTSTWNFANPLSFQGGPWYQAMRDTAVLGTSSNEFERREAKSNLSRMWGRGGTPFTGIANPIGGATTDWLQAAAADDPVEAMMLALGFNTQSPKPATSR